MSYFYTLLVDFYHYLAEFYDILQMPAWADTMRQFAEFYKSLM